MRIKKAAKISFEIGERKTTQTKGDLDKNINWCVWQESFEAAEEICVLGTVGAWSRKKEEARQIEFSPSEVIIQKDFAAGRLDYSQFN